MMARRMHIGVADAGLHVKMYAHVNEDTQAQRPTLIFLHEALGSVEQWKSFPYELCQATGCDGVVYDRKGHGKSSPMTEPRRLDFYQLESEIYLQGLLDALNIRRPLLVGHSDGATIALMYASLFPERCDAVISEAAHVLIEDITLDGIREAKKLYGETDLRGKLQRYHGNNTDDVFSAWADTWLAPGLAEWDMLDDLQSIRCPVMVVQGEDDHYGSRRQVDAIEAHVAGSSEVLWLSQCGHVPHLQARPRVLDAMHTFIDRVIAESR
ncbi:alpha/beta hydrolase [bacterium]|nr:alpha/beta hydrolase [bacterium]